MCGPKFCSMELTQQLRQQAMSAEVETLSAQVADGLRAKAAEFREAGAELYQPVAGD